MIVNGKMVWYDLSRFKNCTIKKAAICDLMQIPAFSAMLENEKEFAISDAWLIEAILQIRESGDLDYRQRNLLRHAYHAYQKAGKINDKVQGAN